MIGASIINMHNTLDDGIGVRKNDVVHIAFQFPKLGRFENRVLWSADDACRIIFIKKTDAKPVDMVIVIPVIEMEPALVRFYWDAVAADRGPRLAGSAHGLAGPAGD